MKKLLTVSLVAMMAVTTARAEIASKAYVDQQDGQLSTLKTTAKTNLVAAINELSDKAGATSVADQIAAALEDYTETGEDESYAPADVLSSLDYTSSGDGVVTAVSQTDGQVAATKAKITNAEVDDNAAIAQSKIAGLGSAASADVASSIAENGTGLATAGQVYTAVQGAQTASVANLDLTEVGGNGNVILTVSQTDGQVAATAGKITNANVDDNAAIASSKIAGLGTAAALDSASSVTENGTGLPTAGAVYTAVEAAKTASVSGLDYTGATGGNVITQVTQTDGAITATMGNAIMSGIQTLSANQGDGVYALTMIKDGTTETYKWEMIQRAVANQQSGS